MEVEVEAEASEGVVVEAAEEEEEAADSLMLDLQRRSCPWVLSPMPARRIWSSRAP